MLKKTLKGSFLMIAVLLFWQFLCAQKLLNPLLLPSPLEIGRTLWVLFSRDRVAVDILSSIRRVLMGFAFGSLAGVPLGLFLGWHKRFSYYITPSIEMLRPIPPIAWIPLAILWFGIGDASSYFITTVASFFPIFVNSFAGARSVETVHINAALCLGAGKLTIFRRVLMPSAAPYVFTGMRVGLGFGWMSVIASELIAAQSGLGYLIQLNRMLLNIPSVIALMIIIGITGYLMNLVLLAVQKRMLPWKKP